MVDDYYLLASPDRCPVFPQHRMVDQGYSPMHYASIRRCACGKEGLGLTDAMRYRAEGGSPVDELRAELEI